MARVVLVGDIASWRRRARGLEPTRTAKPTEAARAAAVRRSSCTLCGELVTPDGSGHDPGCWGMD